MKLILRLILVFVLCLIPISLGSQATMCGRSTSVTVTAGSTTEIITPDPGQSVGVCGFVFTGNTASTGVQIKTGSGTSCATNCVNQTGVMLTPANGPIVVIKDTEIFSSGTGNSVYVAATTGTVTGMFNFRTRP